MAEALRAQAHQALDAALSELRRPVSEFAQSQVFVIEGGPDHGNAHWYRFEVGKSARDAGKFANFTEAHYFVKASFRAQRERLVFVVSFHHIGRELSGIMEVTAFAQLESFENSEDRESMTQDFFVCSIEPFVFTYQTRVSDIRDAFSRWLDQALAVAIKEFGDRL